LFSGKGFDKQKKYFLFSLWNAGTPYADVHTIEFNTMKPNFAGQENIEFVNVEWRLKNISGAIEKYQIESRVEYGKHIRQKGDKFTLNISFPNAFFLVEDSRAAFLCSGSICAKKVKQFFNTGSSR
jgi:hypothetical protein